jgi:hypothetical protein
MGLGHRPRTGLAMPDVVRRLAERRAAQLVVAASAGDQELTHSQVILSASHDRERADVLLQSRWPYILCLERQNPVRPTTLIQALEPRCQLPSMTLNRTQRLLIRNVCFAVMIIHSDYFPQSLTRLVMEGLLYLQEAA